MKNLVLKYGLISGLIVSTTLILSAIIGIEEVMMGDYGMIIGFGSMIIAFAFVFVGIKKYRDDQNGGIVTFGKAFKIGLLISFTASTFYVFTWLIEYYTLYPNFMDTYIATSLEHAKAAGKSAAELKKMDESFDVSRSLYSNPFGIIAVTYSEIFPLGIVVSLIAALVMMRRSPRGKNHIVQTESL
ncbi:MAG: DUF4199 domain-containing protein [Flavobacterium sp.]|uniref:DUF4199 domain-containing protein n=1 Tax=Flavobacterium sp. TaxID=239 RepID=UPI0011F4FEE2|nr:DUF4199 domain-containing protein [Flavobacterium sp.]RZJ64222.1 MAG: DUF4199 domain-containing protein [Flavobacterium sp.]